MENLAENFFLGLCALIGGDFVFLPYDLKIYKVYTEYCSGLEFDYNKIWHYRWHLKFGRHRRKKTYTRRMSSSRYFWELSFSCPLCEASGMLRRYYFLWLKVSQLTQYFSSLESRHLLYLQLRKSILESQILCNEDDLIALGGLALQAEIGDFQPKVSYIITMLYSTLVLVRTHRWHIIHMRILI